MIDSGEAIEVQYVHGRWRGVNDLEDFRRAGDFSHEQTPFTPSVHAYYALVDALVKLEGEGGWSARHARHAVLANRRPRTPNSSQSISTIGSLSGGPSGRCGSSL